MKFLLQIHHRSVDSIETEVYLYIGSVCLGCAPQRARRLSVVGLSFQFSAAFRQLFTAISWSPSLIRWRSGWWWHLIVAGHFSCSKKTQYTTFFHHPLSRAVTLVANKFNPNEKVISFSRSKLASSIVKSVSIYVYWDHT